MSKSLSKPQTVTEQARAVRELFSDPARWQAGSLIADASGHALPDEMVHSELAVCFCLVGGVARVASTPEEAAKAESLYQLFDATELGRLVGHVAISRRAHAIGTEVRLEGLHAANPAFMWNDYLHDAVPGVSREGRHAQFLDMLDEVVLHAEAAGI